MLGSSHHGPGGMADMQPDASVALQGARRALDLTGLITNVQRFRVSDGPGVRSTVVLKGCPSRCVWCDSRDQWLLRPEVGLGLPFRGELSCARSQSVLELLADPTTCATCRRCPGFCEHDLLRTIGREWTMSELMALLARDEQLYLRSGGGITLAGGEPLYQSEFATALLRLAKRRRWHTAVYTGGQTSITVFEEALRHCDLVLFELKETDFVLHQRWTGSELEPIVRNLVRAAVGPCELRIRLPVVPSYNDRDEHWEQVGCLLADLPGPPRVELVPHVSPTTPGEARLGPTAQRLDQIVAGLRSHGLRAAVA